ncbi:MAG: hypothetical protein Q8936_12575 [Bacillota bacterium]|nr:hypothetical protein [Bacillota bacterium]
MRDNLFVRINFKAEDSNDTNDSNDKTGYSGAHINHTDIKATKYLIGGGFYNKNSGSIVFKARDLNEVNQITNNNPLIKNKKYKYDLVILPDRLKKSAVGE